MNFLSLAQRLLRETGIANSGITNVTSQTGDFLRMVDWTNEAWLRIQSMRRDWAFLWAEGSSTTVIGDATLTLASDIEAIPYMVCDGSVLTEISYEDYRSTYPSLSDGKPSAFAIRPDGKVAFNALPDAAYDLTYEYYKKPTYMSENIDVPSMPERFHMLIVWHALREYAVFDEAPELVQKADLNFAQVYAELVLDQTPEVTIAGAIA